MYTICTIGDLAMDEFWIIIISFVIVVAVFIWWVYKKLSAKNEFDQAPVQPTRYYIGDRLANEIRELTVTEVTNMREINGKWQEKTENNFVVVSIDYSNIGTTEDYIESSWFKLKIGEATYYISSATRCLENGLNKIKSLGSGLSAKLVMVFETPLTSIGKEHILYIDNRSSYYPFEFEVVLNKKSDIMLTK